MDNSTINPNKERNEIESPNRGQPLPEEDISSNARFSLAKGYYQWDEEKKEFVPVSTE